MKKILCFIMVLAIALIAVPGYCVDEWDSSDPAGTELVSDIDSLVIANNEALERVFPYLQGGCDLEYLTAATLNVQAGMTVCSNSAGTIRKLRTNTSETTVTWSDLDTGSENASTTYYVYAVGDADTATFTVKISTSSTSPSGVTYYKKLGSFYNNSSSNIEQITDGNVKIAIATGTVADGGTIPLPAGFSQSQCSWIASTAVSGGAGEHNDPQQAYSFNCSLAGRVVTCTQISSKGAVAAGTANYIIIGVQDGT